MNQLLKVFAILILFAIAPIILFALATSFLMNDVSLLNPFYWVTATRFACLIWVAAISLCILGAASDGHI